MLSEFYDPIYEVIEAHEKKAKEEEHENALKEMADKKETNKAELFKYINIANNDKLLTENTSSSSSQQQQQQKEEKYGPGPSEKRNSMAGKSDNATHSMDGSDSSNENKDNVSTDNSNSNDTDAAPNNKVLHLRNPALIEALKEVMTGYLERTWDQLFSECPTSMGKRLSKGERTSLGLVRSSLVYGEIQFKSFATVFWGPHINLLPGGAFYDLGMSI